MELSEKNLREYQRRILFARMRVLMEDGFYGILLMNMQFALDDSLETVATDGQRIWFSPRFLENLDDRELEFILKHEVLHVVLQHCFRNGDRDPDRFNAACDIVVNSNILYSSGMDRKAITLEKYGESMHQTPDGREGYFFTAEEVYEMLPPDPFEKLRGGGRSSERKNQKNKKNKKNRKNDAKGQKAVNSWDDHSRWGKAEDPALSVEWELRLEQAAEAASRWSQSKHIGRLPLCAERVLKDLKRPQIDWRTILNEFVQEEITDYSFSPPDRRFDDSPFFLPDFNMPEEEVRDILFMIDTSGSMSDDQITAAYSEIKGAIDQYDGRLQGWLGFFDAEVVEPKRFEDEEEFRAIRPAGGGGTRFDIIFSYVEKHMQDQLPVSIIILTDGYARFPKEKKAMGIPVLWLLNNEDVEPPWGKVARIQA